MKTWNIRLIGFSLLHVLGAMCIPVLILLLTSCIKKEDDKLDDGPQASSSEVGAAIGKAVEGASITTSKLGDWALTEETQRVLTETPEIKELIGTKIFKMEKITGGYNIQILKSIYDITQSPPVIKSQPIESCQARDDGAHSCEFTPMVVGNSVGPNLRASNYSRMNMNNQIVAMAGQTTYHNLTTSTATVAPPKLVADKPNCGGVPNCALLVTTVEFDEVTHQEGERVRYHHEFDFSTEVPFVGIRLRHCVKWNYKAENRYIPAEVCSRLVNFEYGQ